MMGEGYVAKKRPPHPLESIWQTIVPSPARGEGTSGDTHASRSCSRGDERKRVPWAISLSNRSQSHSNAVLENPRLASAFTNSVPSSNCISLAIVSSAEACSPAILTGEDRLRLENRIDEYVVVHDALVPHGVNGRPPGDGRACASYHHTPFAHWGCTRSVVGGARRGVAETDVEAGAHHALGFFDIDECRAQPSDLRREGNLPRAEIVVVIFDEAGEDVGEGIFTAHADDPTRARLARRVSSPEDDRGRPIIVALPGAAAPDVAEEAIPGVADTAGHARQRPDLAVIGTAVLARPGVGAPGIRQGIVALNADHKPAGKLIVATDLGAADEAMLIVFAERLAVKGAAGGAHDPVLLRGPQAAHGRRGSSPSSSKPGRPAAVPYKVEGACRPRSPGLPAQSARPLRPGISA